jgi:diguanylate cyclase (GGDEF)-like protein
MTPHGSGVARVIGSGFKWRDAAAQRALRLVGPDARENLSHGEEGGRTKIANLSPVAYAYIGAVCAAAATVLIRSLAGVGHTPTGALSALMVFSLLASMIKIEIPVFGNASTLTACHVIDLIALVMFGPYAGVLVSAWGGWTQCTFRTRVRNPPHQTAFSVASLALTMWVAGLVYVRMGGQQVTAASPLHWEPFAAAAALFFVLNTGLVAGAVALTSAKRLTTIWFDFFFSSWPSYVIGAVLAAVIAAGMQQESYWLVPMLITALVLMHRNHKIVVERMNDALTDPLTGLYNQRSVALHVERELSRADRSGGQVVVAVLDIDNFKHINDRIGHAAGDVALRRVAHALRQVVRDGDVCARYGGDEFVLVMSGCTALDARRRLEEARVAVSATRFDGQDVVGRPLTISAGVAVFPDDGPRFETLFGVADARMYDCKHQRS